MRGYSRAGAGPTAFFSGAQAGRSRFRRSPLTSGDGLVRLLPSMLGARRGKRVRPESTSPRERAGQAAAVPRRHPRREPFAADCCSPLRPSLLRTSSRPRDFSLSFLVVSGSRRRCARPFLQAPDQRPADSFPLLLRLAAKLLRFVNRALQRRTESRPERRSWTWLLARQSGPEKACSPTVPPQE